MAYKILIVDDEQMITELLSDHLEDCGYKVYKANTGKEALEQLRWQPDLILLDINMPEMDGIALCKSIRAHLNCPIIFLTARITEQDKIYGLQCGADDYITKPFSLNELTARISAHLRREARGNHKSCVLANDELVINLSERKITFLESEIPFSKTEFELIEFLMKHTNQVFDKERIYEAVWGYEAEGDSNVIKEHIRKIRTKLREHTEKEYIETVWGVGYRWKQ